MNHSKKFVRARKRSLKAGDKINRYTVSRGGIRL